jgi:hypothetical protein
LKPTTNDDVAADADVAVDADIDADIDADVAVDADIDADVAVDADGSWEELMGKDLIMKVSACRATLDGQLSPFPTNKH